MKRHALLLLLLFGVLSFSSCTADGLADNYATVGDDGDIITEDDDADDDGDAEDDTLPDLPL